LCGSTFPFGPGRRLLDLGLFGLHDRFDFQLGVLFALGDGHRVGLFGRLLTRFRRHQGRKRVRTVGGDRRELAADLLGRIGQFANLLGGPVDGQAVACARGIVDEQGDADHYRRDGVHTGLVPFAIAQIRVGVEGDRQCQQGDFGRGDLSAVIDDASMR